jgi:glycine cleavage system H lipoate-binding protein
MIPHLLMPVLGEVVRGTAALAAWIGLANRDRDSHSWMMKSQPTEAMSN